MYIQLSIHKPKPEYESDLIDSMHRFGAAMKGKPGLNHVFTLKDANEGKLFGLAIWESEDAMMAAVPAMIEATKDDDFELWESVPIAGYHLTEV
ncbi:MAG: hypothetical protein WCH46_02410 [bacterium]